MIRKQCCTDWNTLSPSNCTLPQHDVFVPVSSKDRHQRLSCIGRRLVRHRNSLESWVISSGLVRIVGPQDRRACGSERRRLAQSGGWCEPGIPHIIYANESPHPRRSQCTGTTAVARNLRLAVCELPRHFGASPKCRVLIVTLEIADARNRLRSQCIGEHPWTFWMW